jgi:DNA polymerase I-like protein with 3'-5' exonuclease and polymerase domains
MTPILAVDTEATGLGPKDRAFGISWKFTNRHPEYIDIRERGARYFIQAYRDTRCPIVCHNASYDYRMLRNVGISLPLERMHDTVIRATLINEHELNYSLDALAFKYLGRKKDAEIYERMAELFGGRPTRNAQIARIAMAPSEIVSPYAKTDAELTHDLWQWQEVEIERQHIEAIVAFERSVMPAVIEAECRGIRVDVDAAERAVEALTVTIDQYLAQLFDLAGKPFNLNSPKQVRELYRPTRSNGQWYAANGMQLPMTPKGEPSFSADALQAIHDPLALSIIDTRSLIKTRDTFLRGHVLRNAIDGRVYPRINQTKGEDGGTGTGRFSYTEPALQQIPSRDEDVAARLKSIFLPDEGQIWLDADMHSFEVRVFIHLINNVKLIQLYYENPLLDFHQHVAELMGLPRKAKHAGEANAKTLDMAMLFSCGDGLVADMLSLPWEWSEFKKAGRVIRYRKAGVQAKELIEKYHQMIPGIRNLSKRASSIAEQFGYCETYAGRHLRFQHGYGTHKASALTTQATAADINKKNWLLIREALDGQGHLLLNTHDSYGISVPENWQPLWKRIQEAVQEGHPWMRVPLILELSGIGVNWWDAISGEKPC